MAPFMMLFPFCSYPDIALLNRRFVVLILFLLTVHHHMSLPPVVVEFIPVRQ